MTFGAATPFIAAGFGLLGAGTAVKGAIDASEAKTDGEAKAAYETIGEGIFGMAASASGLKVFKGTKGAKTNVKTSAKTSASAKSSAKNTEPTAERTSANPKAPEPTNTATNSAKTAPKPSPKSTKNTLTLASKNSTKKMH